MVRHHRERQGQDSGQGRNPSRSAEVDLRRQATRGWPYPVGLQHSEGIHLAFGSPSQGWKLKFSAYSKSTTANCFFRDQIWYLSLHCFLISNSIGIYDRIQKLCDTLCDTRNIDL